MSLEPLITDEQTRRFPRLRLHTIVLSLIGGGIVHICMTFGWPLLAAGNPVRQIAAALPGEGVHILPSPPRGKAVMAFQGTDSLYAACRFNVADAAVAVRATLPEPGWMISVLDGNGDSLYVVTGQGQRRTDVSVLLLPAGDRFVGLLPETRFSSGFAQVVVPDGGGIVLIRAPNKGTSYKAEAEAELAKATCVARRQ